MLQMSKYLKLSNRILEKREKETKQLELDLKEKEEKKKKLERHPNEGMKTSSPLEETSFIPVAVTTYVDLDSFNI